ncbi:MAG TPA: family 1 glycosylhydrolase [Rhizomicrobium sp.]|nr:family 1 glycosylhydrolase [Rhizomicrobium sp.]
MSIDAGITRRALAPFVAGAAIAGAAACSPQIATEPVSRRFPKDFLWGVATSAFQIEGACDAGGRGPSIWDVFAGDPSHIADHSDASLATDSYRRCEDDVALIADAGLKAYRFSISWPRVLPEGAGAVNEEGLDYYSRLVDALLEKRIAPYATLFHWDLPEALYEVGGWGARDTAMRLADYAGLIGNRLGDRIKNFIILNEAAVHTIVGHVIGRHAPGIRGAKLLGPATHHQNLGQGLSIKALRAVRSDCRIGTTMALMPSRPEGSSWHVMNDLPAYAFESIWNGAYLDPLFRGGYPLVMLPFVDGLIKDGDMTIARQPIDFLGVNYYSPTYIKFDRTNPAYVGPGLPPEGVPLDAFGREIDPKGLSEVLARLRDDYGNPEIIVTENGCSDGLGTGPARLDDRFRIAYLTHHLEAVKAAMDKGSPVRGFFAWTLVDNWEWDEGYMAKFGLVSMDRKTGLRLPKASYHWLKELAHTGVLKPF